MIKAFKHLGWFFKENLWKYFLCCLTLVFVSVMPVVPAKFLGLAIDEIAMGTITIYKLVFYLCGLFLVPFSVYLVNIGKMEVGTIILVYTYYDKIITNFEVLGTISAEYQSFLVSLKRINKLGENTSVEKEG